jgi:hypothetical protein
MSDFRHILEKYKGPVSRFICPACKHGNKTFAQYIDKETSAYIHSSVGRCNREIKCGYHYTPKQYFEDNKIEFQLYKPISKPTMPAKPLVKLASYIDIAFFQASLKQFQYNNLILFLINRFGIETTKELIKKYCIGTSKYWEGASVFWQIDTTGKIRTGKIMLYNSDTGKRVKEPFNHITWVHKATRVDEFNLQQCFFGEHLLIDKSKPVAIVESEKTAIISSLYFPQFIWLATGSLNNLNETKCYILKGRQVTLFPDLKAFDLWEDKAYELNHIVSFNVSDLLERKASSDEKEQGFDLADYLLMSDPLDFIKKIEEPVKRSKHISLPSKTSQAYVDSIGNLYIPTPLSTTYSIYPSIEHYNQRSCLPSFEPKTNVNIDNMSKVIIDLKSLGINVP